MNPSRIIAVTFCAALAALPAAALTVAEARALPDDALVEIGPVTVTTTNDLTSGGFAIPIQDGTGGVLLYWNSPDTGRPFVENNGLVPGSSITIQGSNDWYNGLYELKNIAFVTNHGFAGVPVPQPLSWDKLRSIPDYTNYINTYIIISNARFQVSGTFANSVNYYLTNFIDNAGAVMRIQDPADPLVGQPIPSGDCTIIAIYSYYNSPQLCPLEIIPQTAQDTPNLDVHTNFGFGYVYPGQTRTLSLRIKNSAGESNLVVTSFAPVSGDTNLFNPELPAFPITLPPQSSEYINVTYPGGAVAAAHAAQFTLACNDPSDPTATVTFWGGVSTSADFRVWINELDYDTPGSAVNEDNEFIELCGPAGLVITGWSLEFWYSPADGQYTNYATHIIGSSITNFAFPNDTNGYGYYVLASYDTLPDFPHVDERASFSEFRNDSPNAVRLVNAEGQPVHFLECETYNANAYPCGWPDDVTSSYDSNDPEQSLGLICTGFDRTGLVWAVFGYTPGAPNIPGTNLPPAGLTAQLPEDTYVQLNYSNNYQGGRAYINVEADSFGNYAARTWLKFNTSNVVAQFDADFGAGQWELDSATLRLTEYSVSWSQPGTMLVYHQPDTAWWEGPLTPPSGVASNNMLCWNVEALYTNGATLAGTFKSKGGYAENRCTLDVTAPPLATALYHSTVFSLRIVAEDGAAAYFSQNYTNVPNVLPQLFVNAVPEPLAAGLISFALAAVLTLRRAY